MNVIGEIKSSGKNLHRSLVFACVLFFLCSPAAAQDLPKEIRGYKVYQARISVVSETEKTGGNDESKAFVKVGEPELVDVSLTGVTFELSAKINSTEQSGKVDFLTFKDFRVNGLKVEIEEYRQAFEFKKKQSVMLPKPARITLGTTETVRGALNEARESKSEWLVTGRVFVFGRFKKFGIPFKRVIPVEINLKIKNPLI